MGLGKTGLKCHGLTAMRQCLHRPVELEGNSPEVPLRLRKVGAKRQRGLELVSRLVNLAQSLQGQTEVILRLGIVSPETQCDPAMDDSLLELADCPIRLGQIGVEQRLAGAQGNGLATELDGLRRSGLARAAAPPEGAGLLHVLARG